jgi:hypothetical protein
MNLDDPFFMTQERSRQIGRALMALSGLQLLVFFFGFARRSHVIVALPVGLLTALTSGLLFWVGYTLAVKDWDDPADYPPAVDEGAPPPDALG